MNPGSGSGVAHRTVWGRGFTLTELLVTLGVIGVLGGLLLSTLASTRGRALQVDCLNRQRNLVLAFQLYSEENGRIPREGYEPYGEVVLNTWSQVAGRVSGGISDSDSVWYNALPRFMSGRPAADFSRPSQRRSFYRPGNILHCPAARFPAITKRANFPFALFSTAMNSHLIRAGEGPSIPYDRVANSRYASQLVLFLDNLLEGEAKVHPAQENHDLGQPASFADRFSPRHRGGGNLVFADGHGGWFKGDQVVETREGSPLKGGPIVPSDRIIWEVP